MTFISCTSLYAIYYKGQQQDKSQIKIGKYNDELTSAAWYFYTPNGAKEKEAGYWWWYTTDGLIQRTYNRKNG